VTGARSADHTAAERALTVEYAVTNFTQVDPDNMTNSTQASLPQIQLFMDVTRSYMESVDWVERYFWFGAMYDMVSIHGKSVGACFD
jgi:hypothetical protein